MKRKRLFFAKGYVHITNSKQRKHLSPSARCAPVNGLAGYYVSTIGTPHEYFDLTGAQPALFGASAIKCCYAAFEC